jgi:hypothetical protein
MNHKLRGICGHENDEIKTGLSYIKRNGASKILLLTNESED